MIDVIRTGQLNWLCSALFAGVAFTLVIFLSFMIILAPYADGSNEIPQKIYLKNSLKTLRKTIEFVSIPIPVFAFIIGIFIQGLRYYLANQYYVSVYNRYNKTAVKTSKKDRTKKKKKCYGIWQRLVHGAAGHFIAGFRKVCGCIIKKNSTAADKAKNTAKEERKYHPWQRLVHYMFRDGTANQECYDNIKSNYDSANLKNKPVWLKKKLLKKKNSRTFYDWIQESGQPQKDMWIFAKKINAKRPDDNIYQFYYMCELFQGSDTAFFLCFIINLLWVLLSALLAPVYLFLSRLDLFNFPGLYPVILPVITPVPMAAVSLLLHWTAKMIAKGFANRFLKAIDDSLKVLKQCQPPL